MKIVTSFDPSRIERQQYCLRTWQALKVPVVAVQTVGEASKLAPHFSGVSFVETDLGGNKFGRPQCPRIKSLLDQAVDEPVLIVNSDISIEDDLQTFQREWVDPTDNFLHVGIRQDYFELGGPTHLQKYGIDAFRVTPRMAQTLPDLGFSIGVPGWDYWISWHLWNEGYPLRVANSSLLHPVHDISWSREEYELGLAVIWQHYRIPRKALTAFIQKATVREHISVPACVPTMGPPKR